MTVYLEWSAPDEVIGRSCMVATFKEPVLVLFVALPGESWPQVRCDQRFLGIAESLSGGLLGAPEPNARIVVDADQRLVAASYNENARGHCPKCALHTREPVAGCTLCEGLLRYEAGSAWRRASRSQA